MPSYSYSFLDVRCTLKAPGGDVRLGATEGGSEVGVADEGITFEKSEDRNTLYVGVNGVPIHFMHSSLAGVVKIRLVKTSRANGQLMDLFKSLRSSGDRWGDITVSLEDRNRGDKVVASEVAFSGEPALTFGKTGGVQEWTLHAGRIDSTLTKE